MRKQENRALAAGGDKSLSGTKYLWLYSEENLPERHQDRFASLRGGDLKTTRAWAIKESLRHFWSYMRRGWGQKHWKRGTSGPPTPAYSRIDAARTLKRHEAGLMPYFAHRVSNAGAEGLNSRIQAIRVSARGHRNRGLSRAHSQDFDKRWHTLTDVDVYKLGHPGAGVKELFTRNNNITVIMLYTGRRERYFHFGSRDRHPQGSASTKATSLCGGCASCRVDSRR